MDVNRLAHRIVGDATKDPDAVSLGRRGGLKGGPARARRLSPERRSEIARKAAEARWEVVGNGPAPTTPVWTSYETFERGYVAATRFLREQMADWNYERLVQLVTADGWDEGDDLAVLVLDVLCAFADAAVHETGDEA